MHETQDNRSTKTNTQNRRRGVRTLLVVLSIVMVCAWGGLLLFTYFLRPEGAAVVVVFALLGVALFCSCVLLTYLVSWTVLTVRGRRPRLGQVIREGGLIAAWLMFNLLLDVLRSWSIFAALVSFGIIVVSEMLFLGQQ